MFFKKKKKKENSPLEITLHPELLEESLTYKELLDNNGFDWQTGEVFLQEDDVVVDENAPDRFSRYQKVLGPIVKINPLDNPEYFNLDIYNEEIIYELDDVYLYAQDKDYMYILKETREEFKDDCYLELIKILRNFDPNTSDAVPRLH